MSHFRQSTVRDEPVKFIEDPKSHYAANEPVRKDQAPLRMLPKGEGFQADDISPRNFDLWLIVKYKFVALDGASKLPVVDVDSRVLPCSSGGLILSSLSQQILQSSRSEWLKKMAGD